jgi:tRNA pseudouridine55 synthase
VVIHAIELLSVELPVIKLRVRCSKGTYIRTLVEDLCKALGSCGHVQLLHRTGVDPFNDFPVFELPSLEAIALLGFEALDAKLLPADAALSHYPKVTLNMSQQEYFASGRSILSQFDLEAGSLVRVYDENSVFLGLAEYAQGDELKPKRVFNLEKSV